jgi:hypothetical protein
MASTRSNTTTSRVAHFAPTETPKQAFFELARDGARIQIAAWTTLAKTLTEWTQSADRLAQAVGDELLRRVDGDTDSAEMAAGVTTASGAHVRELRALPRTAADHFDTRLTRLPSEEEEVA